MKKEKSLPKEAEFVYFNRFPSAGEEGEIGEEIKAYFSKRNTKILFYDECDDLTDWKFKIVDSKTQKPIANAMIYIHKYKQEWLLESDSNGIVVIQ